jgi:hypothetical protein
MNFDFSNAQLPRLLPLETSYAENEIESDLKQLFIDLFNEILAPDIFDVNVSGAAHLGSFELVRKAVNTDGLVLLQGDSEETATRYLYRAWKSGDVQGRGLHFLKTYLQMLFPNKCSIDQLWQKKDTPYPTDLYTSTPDRTWWLHQVGEPGLKLDGTWGLGRRISSDDPSLQSKSVLDTGGMFLTSRVLISLDYDMSTKSAGKLLQILREVMPARLVPVFRFWLYEEFQIHALASSYLTMLANYPVDYPWVVGGFDVSMSTNVPFWGVETLPLDTVATRKIAENQAYGLIENLNEYPISLLPSRTRLTLSGTWKLGGGKNAGLEIFKI